MTLILIYTGWCKKWGDESYFDNYPVLSLELCKVLAEKEIKGVGLDVISIDPIKSEGLSNHNIILLSNKLIIENLNNLDLLLEKSFNFSCFPLKIKNGDGSPIRAVGICY